MDSPRMERPARSLFSGARRNMHAAPGAGVEIQVSEIDYLWIWMPMKMSGSPASERFEGRRDNMAHATRAAFPHRRNPNGHFDSICTQCFLTIATAATEAELKAGESAHDCRGFNLREIMHGTEYEGHSSRL